MGIDTAALHDNSATDLWAPCSTAEFKVLREASGPQTTRAVVPRATALSVRE